MTLAFEAAELPADAIEVGRIADAWGIKGWFKVLPYSASPEALFSSKRWFLQPSEKGAKTFTGTALLKIKKPKNIPTPSSPMRKTLTTATMQSCSKVHASLSPAQAFPPLKPTSTTG